MTPLNGRRRKRERFPKEIIARALTFVCVKMWDLNPQNEIFDKWRKFTCLFNGYGLKN